MNLSTSTSRGQAPRIPAGHPSHHQALVASGPCEQLIVSNGNAAHVIQAEHIDFIEALGEQVQINAHGRGYLMASRLADFKRQLDPALFVEVHATCLVNVACLPTASEAIDGAWVVLRDGSRVPLSEEGRAVVLGMSGRAG
jgi:DNA-binding LytR/AlgR family response regulator